jgi:hypothetical protein
VALVGNTIQNSRQNYRSVYFNVEVSRYNQNNQVEEDEMGRACSTNEGEEESV